jgi:hypothetical protein
MFFEIVPKGKRSALQWANRIDGAPSLLAVVEDAVVLTFDDHLLFDRKTIPNLFEIPFDKSLRIDLQKIGHFGDFLDRNPYVAAFADAAVARACLARFRIESVIEALFRDQI